jgi:multiple sugar transport system permease protein
MSRRGRAPRSQAAVDTRAAWLFISPWVIGFLLFTLYPLIYTGYLSFTDYDVINDPNFVGTQNYRDLVSDDKVMLALRNTFVFTVMSVPTKIVLSLLLALLLNKAGRSAGFFRTAFFLPKMTPPVAIGVLLLLLFNGQSGLINKMLGTVGIDGPAWTTDPDHALTTLILLHVWTFGAPMVIFLAGLRQIPVMYYEAARVDGAGWWRQTMHITIPMCSGALFFLLIVDTIAGFQSFTEAYTAYFGSGNSTYSNDAALFYAIYLFQQAFQFLHMGYASALAMLLFLIIMIVTAVQVRLSRTFVYYESERA